MEVQGAATLTDDGYGRNGVAGIVRISYLVACRPFKKYSLGMMNVICCHCAP